MRFTAGYDDLRYSDGSLVNESRSFRQKMNTYRVTFYADVDWANGLGCFQPEGPTAPWRSMPSFGGTNFVSSQYVLTYCAA
jgi:hypothetical protein